MYIYAITIGGDFNTRNVEPSPYKLAELDLKKQILAISTFLCLYICYYHRWGSQYTKGGTLGMYICYYHMWGFQYTRCGTLGMYICYCHMWGFQYTRCGILGMYIYILKA